MARAENDVTNPRVQGPRRRRGPATQSDDQLLPRLLTVREVADVLRVPPEYVTRRLVFERRIPFVKVGRRTLFSEEDVARFIDEKRVSPDDYVGQSEPAKHGRRIG